MYPWKKRLCIGAALVFTASLGMTALAAGPDPGFSDVSADSWYADAVDYVRSNGLMSGTSAATFDPDGTMTRSMLAQTLYRAAGSPAVSGSDSFIKGCSCLPSFRQPEHKKNTKKQFFAF